jgi:hypothetical protein
MKTVSLLAAAAIVALTGSVASAQDDGVTNYVMRDDSGTWRMFGPDNTEGTEIFTGGRPSSCPPGGWYVNEDAPGQQIISCEGDMAYGLTAPQSGDMMASGEPYPENSFMVQRPNPTTGGGDEPAAQN